MSVPKQGRQARVLAALLAFPVVATPVAAHPATSPSSPREQPVEAERVVFGQVALGSLLDPALGEMQATEGRLSANGRILAFSATSPSWTPSQLYVRDLITGSPAELVSVGMDGAPANLPVLPSSVSRDGRFVAFVSAASNLVPGDTNDALDVFVRDRTLGETQRVSVGSNGQQGTTPSTGGLLSADGTRVAFMSDSSNLVPRDTNRKRDVFVRNLVAGVTRRVSVATGGSQSVWRSVLSSISAAGRHVAFTANGAELTDRDAPHRHVLYVHHLRSGRTEKASVDRRGGLPNRRSFGGALSATGRFVAFMSSASDLVKGDSHGSTNVFVRDLKHDRTEVISVRPKGRTVKNRTSLLPPDGSISDDGRFIVFVSSGHLVPGQRSGGFLRDRRKDKTFRVPTRADLNWARVTNLRVAGTARRVLFMTAQSLVDADTDIMDDLYTVPFR